MVKNKPEFSFRKHDRIGCAAAEDDTEFLYECFVDTGDLELIKDINDNRQIIVGRTGAGKSALLKKLKKELGKTVIEILPENLALTYVSNSTVLNYFEELGVNLDPFFKLLWRHIFAIEILSRHYELHNGVEKKSIFDFILLLFSGDSKKDKEIREAVDYLKKWGEKFWLETEYRVKEITEKVEKDLGAEFEAQAKTPFLTSKAGASSNIKLTSEQKEELKSRGQKIISASQIQDLNKVLKLLDAVLDDRQKQYYIIIDKLDENWVEEKLRYKLIMSLIVTSRELSKVKNSKMIIAMRRDLIDRVFRLSRDSGFQEEKYQSLYLPLKWNEKDIIRVLDKRIDLLVKRRYTKREVTHKELLPSKYEKKEITQYISERVRSPRDIIIFFNKCIEAAPNLFKLSSKELKIAIGDYSRQRLRALGDEWSADYPALLDFVTLLNCTPSSFKLSCLTEKSLEELCLEIAINYPGGNGLLQQLAIKLTDRIVSAEYVKNTLIHVFYKIGLVGLKILSFEKESWVDESGKSISFSEINETISVIVHPTYHRALGTNK